MPGQELNLLCFDGGGVRGLSSLYVLQRLMLAKDPENPPKPCEYFDMIGGTSTGGLIAIMLGRLRMSVEECITAYVELSSRVFQKKHVMPVTVRGKVKARYSSEELQRAIEDVVKAQHLERDALLKDTSPQACKVFVCATSKGVSLPYLLRSYPPTRESPDLYQITIIWEAGRATSAASSFFDPIAIGSLGQEFLDGGTGANNPVLQLWNEAADFFCDGSGSRLYKDLRSIVSIGTGIPDLTDFGDDPLAIAKTLLDMSTETETTANDFHRAHSDLDDEGKYYRFNVARGLAAIGLEEADEAKRIKELTDAYLTEQSTHTSIRRCARTLGNSIVSAPSSSLQTQALVRFPHEGAEILQTWLKNSRWELRTSARAGYQIFDRISDYDAKREHGIIARRKAKNTIAWLCSNSKFEAWLASADPTSHLWVSGKVGSGKSVLMTTIIDECLRHFIKEARSAILFYFYQPAERTAKALFAALVKQLLAALVHMRVPCPPTVRDEIEFEFGMEHRQPNVGELVANIVIPLIAIFEEVVVVVDGPEICDQREQQELWKQLTNITEHKNAGTRIRIAIGSQDHTNVTDNLPNTRRLRLGGGFNVTDIGTFIDDQISCHSGKGQLLCDETLRLEVLQLLKKKANGMFLWASLVLDVVLNRCRTPNEVKQAIHELPTDLEKLYKSFLESKRGSEPLCDPRPIIAICAAPKPMNEEALRQLLALDMTTGSYTPDDMMSTDAVVQSGVGLLTLDSTEKLILPVHDTVRTFMFSNAASPTTNRILRSNPKAYALSPFRARAIRERPREKEARVSLGRACLVHLQFHLRTSRSLTKGPAQMQRTLPTMRVGVPTWLQGTIRTMLPYASRKAAVTVHLPSKELNAPPQRDGFFQYARENWLTCNLDLPEEQYVHEQSQERLFRSIAMERVESWGIHPWPVLTRSTSEHLTGMFAYSIAKGHLPLFKLAMQHKDSLPKDTFTGPLPNHGHLPALHVACKFGHELLLPGLSRVCDLTTRCHMSKTAIHYVAEYGHMNCIEKIAKHFRGYGGTCTLNDIIDHRDSQSRTALHLAITNGHKHVAVCLAETYKASISIEDASGSTAIELACDMGYGFDRIGLNSAQCNELGETDHTGRSRLIVAAIAGKVHRIKTLCTICNVHEPDDSGSTALVHACRGGHESVVRMLLESGFNVDEELATEIRCERFALTAAAAAGHADIVRVLLGFTTVPAPKMKDLIHDSWHPVEAAVLGHYHGSSRSLDAARAIVGDMATSFAEPGNMSAFSTRKGCQEKIDIFLRAAAEIGQVDAIRHLLKLRQTQQDQALINSDLLDMIYVYLDRRGIGVELLEKVGVLVEIRWTAQADNRLHRALITPETIPSPIPVFLAAVRQHEEVLAILLPGRNTDYIQGLMERARGIHLGCKDFDHFLKAHC